MSVCARFAVNELDELRDVCCEEESPIRIYSEAAQKTAPMSDIKAQTAYQTIGEVVGKGSNSFLYINVTKILLFSLLSPLFTN